VDSRKGSGTRLEIQPVLRDALPDVARFLASWSAPEDQEAPSSIEQRLQWLLLENPLATTAPEYGLCIRNPSGVVSGVLLSFPSGFLAGDQRLVALCSGSFFVRPEARTQGFYLFKRHLNSPGYAFFFSTTCNDASGALWKTLGGAAPPNSDVEYVLPLKLETLLPSFLAGRTSSGRVAAVARFFSPYADFVLRRVAQKSTGLVVEPCRDWEKLAELCRRHRSLDWITADRSVAFLRWRYGQNSPNRSSDICVFRDARGTEGWFSLGTTIRGRRGEIRGSILLDAIWPREQMTFRDVLPAIVQRVAATADAIYFRSRPGIDYRECSPLMIPRRMGGSPVFVISGKGDAPLTISRLDLVPADGDTAFIVGG
jgi:hypothetical protein